MILWRSKIMSDREPLHRKIRNDVISHTLWHFSGDKLLEFIADRWRSWLGALVVSAASILWAWLRGLPRLYLAIIGLAAFAVVLFLWDLIIARQRGDHAIRRASADSNPQKLGEIRFDYPGSPLDRWEFKSDDPQNTNKPQFAAPSERPGGITMFAAGSQHIDLRLDPHHKFATRLKFETKLSRDHPSESFAYIKALLTSPDGVTKSQVGWIACDIGAKSAAKHGPNEWIIYRQPGADGWAMFDLHLPKVIEESSFRREEGLEFRELLSFRLRGCVSVSPILLYRAERGKQTAAG
jgi:hypothetical protein